jgi:hypothetical protein
MLIFEGTSGIYSTAAYINHTVGVQILNNLIVGRGSSPRYGLREAIGLVPVAVRNNNIVDLGGGGTAFPYYDANNGCAVLPDCSTSQMNALDANIPYSGNISVGGQTSFVDYAAANYRLAATADVNLKYGGLDLTGQIATFDFDRALRTAVNGPLATAVTGTAPPGNPQGWSIGASEAD